MSLEVLGVFKSDFIPEVVLCREGDRVGVVLVFPDEFELLFDAFLTSEFDRPSCSWQWTGMTSERHEDATIFQATTAVSILAENGQFAS